jgi:glutathionyl-hydroquinone reductase
MHADGSFKRTASESREIISSSHPLYKPASGRYHLYISFACPWANRCLAVLKMKGLDHAITWSSTHPTWQRSRPNDANDQHHGWAFYDSSDSNRVPLTPPGGHGKIDAKDCEPCVIDGKNLRVVRDLYAISGSNETKYTVPILWDKHSKTIVNNESSEIIRMLNTEFNEWATGQDAKIDLYPLDNDLRKEIDEINEWIYHEINDGVYRCGFAKTQEAYEKACNILFLALDRLENHLSSTRWLCGANAKDGNGSRITEADIFIYDISTF